MTKEELEKQIREIELCLKNINYEGISQLFKRNHWHFICKDEPTYYPEYRDIKRLVYTNFRYLAYEMTKKFNEKTLKEHDKVSSRDGYLRFDLTIDDGGSCFIPRLDRALSYVLSTKGGSYYSIDDNGYNLSDNILTP